MAKKGRPERKPFLFVDTNKFLDFYRARGEAGLMLLKRIEAVSHLLITTPQVEMEFLKNRQKIIWEAHNKITVPNIQVPVPGYLSDSPSAKAVRATANKLRKQVENLKDYFKRLLKNPSQNDPVLRIVKKAMRAGNSLNMRHTPPHVEAEVLAAASKRFQRGLPPRKPDDTTMGDAINWEWILYCCTRKPPNDVLIVSGDHDYGLSEDGGYMNDWLALEFKRFKRKATLISKLSDALKMLDVKVTPAEEKEEQRIIAQKSGAAKAPMSPIFWPMVMERLKAKSPEVYEVLSQARCIKYENDKLAIWYDPESGAFSDVDGLDKPKTHNLMQEVFKESGYAPLKTFIIGLYHPDLGEEPPSFEFCGAP